MKIINKISLQDLNVISKLFLKYELKNKIHLTGSYPLFIHGIINREPADLDFHVEKLDDFHKIKQATASIQKENLQEEYDKTDQKQKSVNNHFIFDFEGKKICIFCQEKKLSGTILTFWFNGQKMDVRVLHLNHTIDAKRKIMANIEYIALFDPITEKLMKSYKKHANDLFLYQKYFIANCEIK